VADYRPKAAAKQKMKKKNQQLQIELEPTLDILKTLGESKTKQFLMGFALETNDALTHAQEKLERKNCDALVLNTMEDAGAGFGFDTNKIQILGKNHKPLSFDLKTKAQVSVDICNYIEKHLKPTDIL